MEGVVTQPCSPASEKQKQQQGLNNDASMPPQVVQEQEHRDAAFSPTASPPHRPQQQERRRQQQHERKALPEEQQRDVLQRWRMKARARLNQHFEVTKIVSSVDLFPTAPLHATEVSLLEEVSPEFAEKVAAKLTKQRLLSKELRSSACRNPVEPAFAADVPGGTFSAESAAAVVAPAVRPTSHHRTSDEGPPGFFAASTAPLTQSRRSIATSLSTAFNTALTGREAELEVQKQQQRLYAEDDGAAVVEVHAATPFEQQRDQQGPLKSAAPAATVPKELSGLTGTRWGKSGRKQKGASLLLRMLQRACSSLCRCCSTCDARTHLRDKWFPSVESTPPIVAARIQATPFNVNRFVLLGVYVVYSLLTGRVYFAWPNISNMLFRSEAYIWLCDERKPAQLVDMRLPENGGRRYACEAQNSQIQQLFIVCLACAYGCALLAGFLLDKVGPKITAMFGQCCNCAAWLLLGSASKDFQSYYPAFVVMGVGVDSGYMAVLSVANLFPGHEGLVVAILGSAKSLSFAMPTILDTLEDKVATISFKDVSIGYAALGPGVCFIISLFLIQLRPFLPWTSFLHIEDAMEELARTKAITWGDVFRSSSLYSLFSAAGSRHKSQGTLIPQSDTPRKLLFFFKIQQNSHDTSGLQHPPLPLDNSSSCQPQQQSLCAANLLLPQQMQQQPQQVCCRGASFVGSFIGRSHLRTEPSDSHFNAGNGSSSESMTGRFDSGSVISRNGMFDAQPPPPSLKQQLLSKFALLMMANYVVQALLYPFLSTCLEDLLGKEVNDFFGLILPFSCVTCLIFGRLTDSYGIMKVLLSLNAIIGGIYGLTLLRIGLVNQARTAAAVAYTAAVLLVVYVGFYSSQVYCYVNDTFAAQQFGRIVGVTFMVAGFCSLLKIPLHALVTHTFQSNYLWPLLLMLLLAALNACVLTALFIFKKKEPHPFWPQEATAAAAAAAKPIHKKQEQPLDAEVAVEGTNSCSRSSNEPSRTLALFAAKNHTSRTSSPSAAAAASTSMAAGQPQQLLNAVGTEAVALHTAEVHGEVPTAATAEAGGS